MRRVRLLDFRSILFDMKHRKNALRRAFLWRRVRIALLLASFLLPHRASAQTLSVDITPAHAIPFDPDQALGSSMDILPANLVDSSVTVLRGKIG
jgi:hypothetical protein